MNGELTIATAAQARAQLLQALDAGAHLDLDTREVTEVDAAGLQLLLAAFRSARERKIQVSYSADARGDAVSAGLLLMGISERAWTDEKDHG